MSDSIIVKDDDKTVIYAFTGLQNDDGTPAGVVAGVPARALTAHDLAAMDPWQRMQVHLLSKQDGGAYKKVGRLPAGLAMAPGDDDSDELPPVLDEAPATGRKAS